ncbi:CheR family methyltransferase [Flavobacterium granuli]|uniref:histidine kinase n=1 Tax=Flavobacterium granuli TaxID=280093 RepID=A0ABU1S017_9FLAO|nr:CheR family methyltransferase [Flavobacterium granuli]MDR6844375.1 two-component system CheB/CheR fusion protein [Flavobacterium granuli]
MKSISTIEDNSLLKLLPSNKLIATKAIKISKVPAKKLPFSKKELKKKSFTVVAIGASAGGLEAVTQLLKNISPSTGMAFIYVQHLSPNHKSLLDVLLSKVTQMEVQVIDNMETMKPNNVYVIPNDKEIEVTNGHIKLIPRPKNRTSNFSIDLLFSSLAETHHENVIGVILSGSANDGTRGLKEIKQAGGITFAQDDSAKFSSMPNSAIAEGFVDFVLSPKEIGIELTRISKHPLIINTTHKKISETEIDNNNLEWKIILQLLHKRKNVDFSHYKMNTIKRRMLRRMLVHKIKTLKEYAELLMNESNEVDILYQDLLINVTAFFRDTEPFLHLKNVILPKLLETKTAGETLRIWVAACATGEEVYSIAMILFELQESSPNSIPFQIFASDLSGDAIRIARTGEYSTNQLATVSQERLHRFFIKSKNKYRISKELRDVCVFAKHNILRDPPFSRMDFISCRNMLIYLDTTAQKKAISTFHYALNDGGCLMLGKSETIGTIAPIFTILDKKFKFYSRKKNSGLRSIPDLTSRLSHSTMSDKNTIPPSAFKKVSASVNGTIGMAFDNVLLEHHVPASVIINYDLEILQFRGSTSLYLKHSPGKASFNILKMAHIEITFELRNAIHHAIKTKLPIRKMGIEMNRNPIDNTIQIVNLEVIPLNIEGEEPLLIVIFTGYIQHETEEDSIKAQENNTIAKDRRIKKLEDELAAARADMGSITHDQEAANEELQSANEEIVSSNEELQSLNEELETSKEEIESTNEELVISNQELHSRIQQVEELNQYNEAILSTVHEPVLVLDKEIKIKSANISFCKTFHVTEEECIGKSLYQLGNNQWNIKQLKELLEEIVPKNNRFHDFEVEHVFPVIGKKIMLLNAHRIVQTRENEELIVLTIIDITDVRNLAIELQVKETKALEIQLEVEKKVLKLIEDSNKRYNMMLMQSPFSFAILKGKDMIIALANDSIKEIWGKGSIIEGNPIMSILPELKDGPIPKMLDDAYTKGVAQEGYELLVPLMRNGKLDNVYFNFVYQPYLDADGTILGVTIIAYEVTAQINLKDELIEARRIAEQNTKIAENALKSKQQFLSNMSHEIRTPMNAIIGFTNVVLKTDLNKEQKEFISAIKSSGSALIVLINDILDLAKVDAGKMAFDKKNFNIFESIADIFYLFESKCSEKNLKLEQQYDTRIPEYIVGDSIRLRQIILNLISNAIKFTSKGKIILRVQMLKEDLEKTTIEFTLTDTGIGIPKNKLATIFDNFEQASTEISRLYGGTGLGLAIVKQLVEHQGGTLIVKSEEGKGSTFGFIMDFGKFCVEAPTEAENIQNTIEGLENIKVLVAEDVPLNQLLIKIILEEFGFQCDIAENGKVAIEKLKENSYDIILMDILMPEMNGFEATDYIRNIMNSKIPIIALTADVTTVDVQKSKTVGMNDYISKPIDEKLLYDKIIKQLKKTLHKK